MQRLRLVRPQPVDPPGLERGGDLGVQRVRDRDLLRRPGMLGRLHDEPLVLAPGLQQGVPRLDVAHDRHRHLTLRASRCSS
jgi:hypothetical protein